MTPPGCGHLNLVVRWLSYHSEAEACVRHRCQVESDHLPSTLPAVTPLKKRLKKINWNVSGGEAYLIRIPSTRLTLPAFFLIPVLSQDGRRQRARGRPPSRVPKYSGKGSAMGSSENQDWLLDCPLVDEIPVTVGDLAAPAGGFYWAPQGFDGPTDARSLELPKQWIPTEHAELMSRYLSRHQEEIMSNSVGIGVGIDGPVTNPNGLQEVASRKRPKMESCAAPGSKACREKLRRDKLNDRFLELGAILEPGKPPKMDKAAILSDAVRLVKQLRGEAEKLKESNDGLQEKIKELKAEKNELRDEKQRLKVDKENLEQQVKAFSSPLSFVPHHHPPILSAPFPVQGQNTGNKLMMPVISYPSFPMWHYMPPADVDTSQDVESCPPVA